MIKNSHILIIISKVAIRQKANIPSIHSSHQGFHSPQQNHQVMYELRLQYREGGQAQLTFTLPATRVHLVDQVSADWEKPETTVDSPSNAF